jgi:hypothetical protein
MAKIGRIARTSWHDGRHLTVFQFLSDKLERGVTLLRSEMYGKQATKVWYVEKVVKRRRMSGLENAYNARLLNLGT